MTDEPLMHLAAISLDCPDPTALARFYAQALGGQAGPRRPRPGAGEDPDPDEVWLTLGSLSFIFRRDTAYREPTWPGPESPPRSHFDCYVVDLPATEARLHALGARTAEFQPEDADDYVVMLDPAGRPFCISELP